ncbi:MAG TPA: hypothetical protein VNX21_04925 [Candidatus Thermoplasmatota archaeon]|nr:hypothetical protein [Candidatus Thermoplasmatota archaeon]
MSFSRTLVLAALALGVLAPATLAAAPLLVTPYAPPADAWCEVRAEWTESLLAAHPAGAWAPLRFEPTDAQLAKLGLPPREALQARRYPEPTLVTADGRAEAVGTPDPVVYAGPGCLGIRPGGLVLTLTGGAVAWCTLGHVYGAPGSYQVSTAGHCGNVGDVATVVAGFGTRGGVGGVVLLDIGRFARSTGDGGIGKDWALIGVDARWQHLVSPTMCFWGGPLGVFTLQGDALRVEPTVPPGVHADPALLQTILRHGHGSGAGGPRVGEALSWRAATYAYLGHIAPGDAGSPTLTLGGDEPGAQREAAGIDTHVLVDPSLRSGAGTILGTRVTLLGTPANGQFLPYPSPFPAGP